MFCFRIRFLNGILFQDSLSELVLISESYALSLNPMPYLLLGISFRIKVLNQILFQNLGSESYFVSEMLF